MNPLIHCIYASLATPEFKEHQIPLLLTSARTANARRGVSGMLLYIDGHFFQVLEGEPQIVDGLYETIRRDSRHSSVTRILREPLAVRHFSEWTMGFNAVDPQAAGKLVGQSDFFETAAGIARLDGGRAKKLLLAFAAGRWRLERTGTHRALG